MTSETSMHTQATLRTRTKCEHKTHSQTSYGVMFIDLSMVIHITSLSQLWMQKINLFHLLNLVVEGEPLREIRNAESKQSKLKATSKKTFYLFLHRHTYTK